VEEAVNRLRINVSFLGSDIRRIMVISSEPNEGKSFVAFNLWSQMAEAGEKVLLIDADMRNSSMYDKYQLSHSDGSEVKGLSHYLSGNAELEEVGGYLPATALSIPCPSAPRFAFLHLNSIGILTSTLTCYLYHTRRIDAPLLVFDPNDYSNNFLLFVPAILANSYVFFSFLYFVIM
jgi:hypothetical protein